MISLTAKKVLDAYGGEELWKNSKYIEAEVSVKGLNFTLKQRPTLNHAKIKMEIGRPFSKLYPIGNDKNIVGVLDGINVRLENEYGEVIAVRKDARKYFPFGRRLFYWDDLDLAYFANDVFWNYFTFPNLLLNETIIWTEKEEGLLEAVFPDARPTPNKTEQFHIEVLTGRLIQRDYTVEIKSKHATPANVVLEHKVENVFLYPSSKKVTPRTKSAEVLSGPVLIDIVVHDFKLTNDE
jgi:hypothetical protein